MKVYVASRFSKRDDVRRIHSILESRGHEILSRWVDHVPIKPYHENREMASKYSEEDILGVINSDVFIMFASDGGTGLHAELGAAIASHYITGKPEILLVGDFRNRAMFYFHPFVRRFPDFGSALEWLDEHNIQ